MGRGLAQYCRICPVYSELDFMTHKIKIKNMWEGRGLYCRIYTGRVWSVKCTIFLVYGTVN